MARKKTVNRASPTPSGLSITRSYSTFSCSWSGGYDQAVNMYEYRNNSATYRNLGANVTSTSISINTNNYYPVTNTILSSVGFCVRGDKNATTKKEKIKKKTWTITTNWTLSSWSYRASISIVPPAAPTVTVERKGDLYDNEFTINLPNHVNDRNWWATQVQYQHCLRIDKNDTDGSKIDSWETLQRSWIYNSITQSDTTTFTCRVVESDTVGITNSTNAVRWFRARVVGPGGNSPWIYSKVAFKEPYPAVITQAVAMDNDRDGCDCSVYWDYQYSISRPIDTMNVQYAFVYPGGVYTDYVPTNDLTIDQDKTYYSVDATIVGDPDIDRIWQYYEATIPVYKPFIDRDPRSPGYQNPPEIVEGEKYYIATKVVTPSQQNIDYYYIPNTGSGYWAYVATGEPILDKSILENVNDAQYRRDNGIEYVNYITTYTHTADTTVNVNSDYYLITEVVNPTQEDAEEYLVIDGVIKYYKSKDLAIDRNKKYYTLDVAPVLTPSQLDIQTYYEVASVNYLEPVSEISWQDASIGSNNSIAVPAPTIGLSTYHAAVGFSIGQKIPKDQLLYVRVNTVYNSLANNSKYYRCADVNGEIPNHESCLSAPTDLMVELRDDNKAYVSATNNSDAYGVRIAVLYIPNMENRDSDAEVVDVLVPDQEGSISSVVEVPFNYGDGFGIGMYAFIGQYDLSARITESDSLNSLGYNKYTISHILKSDMLSFGGQIPRPPKNVQATYIGDGNVMVTWDWNWKSATAAEVAWSDYSEALDSNSQPTTYEVLSGKHNRLIIRSLETGKNWYFWVRLKKDDNMSVWSNIQSVSLTSSPSIPTLSLSKRYITLDEKFTANWTYVSTDGTPQKSAQICLCSVNGSEVNHETIIGNIPNEKQTDPETQYVMFDPINDELNWAEGMDYHLAVQVVSGSGMTSEKWSDPVTISVIAPINCSVTESSLYPENVSEYSPTETYSEGDFVFYRMNDLEDMSKDRMILFKCIENILEPELWTNEHWTIDDTQTFLELKSLPMSVVIEPDGDVDEITIIIERSQDYFIDRPDESVYGGHVGEVVYQDTNNDGYFEIDQEDLNGYLDDGAYYYLTARVKDSYGQIQEVRYEFRVNWEHQAIKPGASIELDETYGVNKITIETPEVPVGKTVSEWAEELDGDVCDIYRISADGFELLYKDAEFGETYVDPYPTIGDHGGYRIVYRTRNGDYIMPNNDFAWEDFESEEYMLFLPHHIIDFGNDSVSIMYNVNIDNNWHKDFQETHYLGGSIQGDWNPGISKTTSITANVLTGDWDNIAAIRRLARYEGVCHVRTRDGSNFLANVEVSEKIPYEIYYNPMEDEDTKIYEYSLSLTRVDSVEPDGMTLEEWLDNLAEIIEEPTEPEETNEP